MPNTQCQFQHKVNLNSLLVHGLWFIVDGIWFYDGLLAKDYRLLAIFADYLGYD